MFFQFYWEIIDTHNCVSLKYIARWFDLHMLWNDYNRFSYHSSSHMDMIRKNKKKGKHFLPMMRNLRVYSLNKFPIYYISVLVIVIILYITSLELIYLVTESLYLLTTFLQYSLFPPITPRNHKSESFSEFLFSDSTYKWDHTVFVSLFDLFQTESIMPLA